MKSEKQFCVVHLIVGLGKGGAEGTLYNVIKYRSKENAVSQRVLSMGEGDYYLEKIKELGVPVCEFDFRHHPIRSFFQIRRNIGENEVLCCWMYHADLIGYFAGRGKARKIIWNIRHSDINKKNRKKLSWIVLKLCAFFSRKPDVIAFNGYKALNNHKSIGFNTDKSIVLNNGCDIKIFSRNDDANETIKKQLALPNDARIVLSVARNHSDKDIPTFIRSFSKITKSIPNAIAVMCGEGIDASNDWLMSLLTDNELIYNKDVFLLGYRSDLPLLFSAADIYILHSATEAFPNTLIQAMACECAVLATNVGEVPRIIENKKYIVSVADDEEIAQKAIDLLTASSERRKAIGLENRKIISDKYNINKTVKEYEALFY